MKQIVIRVNINCKICKMKVFKAAARLSDIDAISVDGETLIVLGEVDPVMVITKLRKIGKTAEIMSVGPPKPPMLIEQKEEKKKEGKAWHTHLPDTCRDCRVGFYCSNCCTNCFNL